MFLECGHCLWSSAEAGTVGVTGTVEEIKAAVATKMDGDYTKVYDELVEQYQVSQRRRRIPLSSRALSLLVRTTLLG
jgi:hypothetical protein